VARAFDCAGLGAIAATAHPDQDAPRKAQFQSLHDRRWRTILRFADQQMRVLGHNHVTEDYELIPLSYPFQNSEKQVAPPRKRWRW